MNKENRKKVEVIMRAIDKYQEVMVTSETQLIINGISIFFRNKDKVSFDINIFQVWCSDLLTSTVFIPLSQIRDIQLNGRTITFE